MFSRAVVVRTRIGGGGREVVFVSVKTSSHNCPPSSSSSPTSLLDVPAWPGRGDFLARRRFRPSPPPSFDPTLHSRSTLPLPPPLQSEREEEGRGWRSLWPLEFPSPADGLFPFPSSSLKRSSLSYEAILEATFHFSAFYPSPPPPKVAIAKRGFGRM